MRFKANFGFPQYILKTITKAFLIRLSQMVFNNVQGGRFLTEVLQNSFRKINVYYASQKYKKDIP